MSDQQSHGHGHEAHGTSQQYFAVFIALLVLTAMSFGAFAVIENSTVSRMVMMAISCAKASLVIMFFMHLKWEANWKYVLTFPSLLMSAFLIIMLIPDVGWRMQKISRERALFMAPPQTQQHGHGRDAEHESQVHDEHDAAPAAHEE